MRKRSPDDIDTSMRLDFVQSFSQAPYSHVAYAGIPGGQTKRHKCLWEVVENSYQKNRLRFAKGYRSPESRQANTTRLLISTEKTHEASKSPISATFGHHGI